jgi:hypothetical protein
LEEFKISKKSQFTSEDLKFKKYFLEYFQEHLKFLEFSKIQEKNQKIVTGMIFHGIQEIHQYYSHIFEKDPNRLKK